LLSFDPTGQTLEKYFRKYPSLVNCTTIDWYLPWPKEALMAVSMATLLPSRELIQDSVRHGSKGLSPPKIQNSLSGPAKIKTKPLDTIAEGNEGHTSMKKPKKEGESEAVSEVMSDARSDDSSMQREEER
jgi:hypothetical protein